MPRFFTLEQARQVLPEIEATVRTALRLKAEFEEAQGELQRASQRIAMMGGTMVHQDRVLEQKRQRDIVTEKLKAAIEEIHSYGCLVKDLDLGLIDFPTLYHGDEVYLCWKLGESGIDFWHGISEGFRGRKRIDREFLDNHQGDLPN